jgi:hypothetical protein
MLRAVTVIAVALMVNAAQAQQADQCDRLVDQLVDGLDKHEKTVTTLAGQLQAAGNSPARNDIARRLCGAYGRGSGYLEIMAIAARECVAQNQTGRDVLASIETAATEFRTNLPRNCP